MWALMLVPGVAVLVVGGRLGGGCDVEMEKGMG